MILAVGVAGEHVRLLTLSERSRLASVATSEELDSLLASATAPWEAILLGPALADPLRAAQRVKERDPLALILILATPESAARLQHALLLAPLSGELVRVVALDEAAPHAIERHLTQARLRRRNTQALRQASQQVPDRPVTALRLPPMVERFFEASPGAVFLIDEAGRVAHSNRAGRALLPAASRPGRFVDALPVEDRDALRILVERADPARPQRVVLADGSGRVFDAVATQAQPAPDRQGTLVTLHDVTSLVRAEIEREREARLHRTLLAAQAQMGVGILSIENGRPTYVNEAFTAMTGFTLEDFHKRSIYELPAPEERDAVRDRAARRERGERVEPTYETVILCKDGRRLPVETTATSLGSGAPTILLIRDASARRTMEAELDGTRRAVAQMDKLASMGSLVGGLAHEIRTPLTAIMNRASHLDVLAKRALEDPDPRAAIAELPAQVAAIHESVDRIRGLVKDMNRFMRGETPSKVVGSLDAPVADAARLFQATQLGRIRVVTRLASTRPVLADPAQVQQIVINLLQNAAEASGSGAAVTVLTRDAPDEGVELVVEDRGRGIPPDLQARMFEAFVTTKPGGTGLGLAIVRRLAEIHGARIRVESEPGVGTTFAISFPAA